jgi:hypothetical protein
MLTKYSQHEKSNDLGYFRKNELLYFQKCAYSMLQLTDRKGERAGGGDPYLLVDEAVAGGAPGGRGGGGRGSWWSLMRCSSPGGR